MVTVPAWASLSAMVSGCVRLSHPWSNNELAGFGLWAMRGASNLKDGYWEPEFSQSVFYTASLPRNPVRVTPSRSSAAAIDRNFNCYYSVFQIRRQVIVADG